MYLGDWWRHFHPKNFGIIKLLTMGGPSLPFWSPLPWISPPTPSLHDSQSHQWRILPRRWYNHEHRPHNHSRCCARSHTRYIVVTPPPSSALLLLSSRRAWIAKQGGTQVRVMREISQERCLKREISRERSREISRDPERSREREILRNLERFWERERSWVRDLEQKRERSLSLERYLERSWERKREKEREWGLEREI